MDQVQKLLASNPQISSDVDQLKSWLKMQHHLPSTVSDNQFVTFLNGCSYNLEATKQCIEAYFTIKCGAPEFFKNRDPLGADVQQTYNVVDVVHLSAASPEGYRYMFLRLADPEPSHYFPDANVKLYLMLFDAVVRHDALAPGFIMIIDMAGLQFRHVARIKIASMKKHMRYVQEAMPVKMKAIHLLNVSPVIHTIVSFVRPFMSKEHFELFRFHTGDEQGMEEFYKAVPRKILPKDYGGEDDTVAELKNKCQEQLASYRDWFREEEEQCTVDESKREGRKTNDGKFLAQCTPS